MKAEVCLMRCKHLDKSLISNLLIMTDGKSIGSASSYFEPGADISDSLALLLWSADLLAFDNPNMDRLDVSNIIGFFSEEIKKVTLPGIVSDELLSIYDGKIAKMGERILSLSDPSSKVRRVSSWLKQVNYDLMALYKHNMKILEQPQQGS